MDEARERVGTELEKQRVAAFEAGIWKPMTVAAANHQLRLRSEPLREALRQRSVPRLRVPRLRVPRVPDAGGDAGAVDWALAAELINRMDASVGAWPTADGYPSERVIEGRGGA